MKKCRQYYKEEDHEIQSSSIIPNVKPTFQGMGATGKVDFLFIVEKMKIDTSRTSGLKLEAIKLSRFGHSMFRIAQDGSSKPLERPRYRFGIFFAE